MSLKNTIVGFLDKSLFWHSEKHITGSQYAIRTLFILGILLFVYISVYNMNFLFAFSRTIEEQVLEGCISQGMAFIGLTIIGMHGAQIIKYLSHMRVLSRNNIPLIGRGIIFTFFTSVICIIEGGILYTWQTNLIHNLQIPGSLAILFWGSIYMVTKKTARDISIPLQNTDTGDKAEIHHPDMAGNILKKYFRTNQENTLSRKTYFIRMVVSILAFIGYASSVMLFCSTAYLYIKKNHALINAGFLKNIIFPLIAFGIIILAWVVYILGKKRITDINKQYTWTHYILGCIVFGIHILASYIQISTMPIGVWLFDSTVFAAVVVCIYSFIGILLSCIPSLSHKNTHSGERRS